MFNNLFFLVLFVSEEAQRLLGADKSSYGVQSKRFLSF